jgi:hypothetical protein
LKKVLKIFGGLCVAVFLLLIILVSIIAYTGRGLDKESKTYADAAIVAITSQWNEKDLTDRASPQFMATVKDPADLHLMMGVLRSLGPLKKYDGSKGEANIDLNWPRGRTITAIYVAQAEFDRGPAEIKISLVKLDGVWKIVGFNVTQHTFSGLWAAKPNL